MSQPPLQPAVDPELRRLPDRRLDRLDRHIAGFMHKYGRRALRYALAVVFIWFGVLKPFGLSPAEDLVLKTVDWVPLVSPRFMLNVIGWWEVAIGLLLLWRPAVRLAILLLVGQMVGTFMPLFMLPEVTFQPGRIPYAPTTEGQYIIKNLVIIAAALVIGGTVRERERDRELL